MPYQTSRSARKLSTVSKGPETLWIPDAKLFALDSLNTPEGLDSAVLNLQMAVFASSQASDVLSAAVTALLSLDPCVLPLILSSDSTLNEHVNAKLQATFPQKAAEYSTSTAGRVLDTLQGFYFSIPASEDNTGLDHLHQTLRKITRLLAALATFDPDPPTSPTATSPTSPLVTEEHDIPFLSKKHRRKKSSVVIPKPTNDKIYHEYGRQRPRDAQEARQMELELLEEAKNILESYISSLVQCHRHAKNQLASKLDSTRAPVQRMDNSSSPVVQETTSPLSPTTATLAKTAVKFIEEDIEDFGSWRILLSGESMRHLRQLGRADRHLFDIVHKKIRQLSIGFFSDSNQKRLVGKDSEVPIYEAKMTRDTRLVYTIDCVPDNTGEHDIQVIKMFGVYTHAQINSRLWTAVAAWSGRRGMEYRKRCNARQTSKQSGDYFIPCSWPPLPESYESSVVIDKDVSLELHALLTHEKFVPLSQAVLDSILADEEASHPFSVSHREQEIIYHPSSCFVIGRSGTGKTTTMMYKMLGIEKTARMASERVRQVFITQSKVLAEKVEESFNAMLETYSSHFMSIEERHWRSTRRKHAEKHLVELDAEADDFSNLPSRFSDLEDKHFPLFLTFDKLCRLIEGDIEANQALNSTMRKAPYAEQKSPTGQLHPIVYEGNGSGATIKTQIRYEDFHSKYWTTFPQPLVKGLDSALVWSEFQGVIRGSELSLQASGGAVDRQTYESNTISFRKQAAFARHRSRLYDLFEVYAKRKRENRDRDAADRTHLLLQYFQNGAFIPTFDYIYVDEVQDNLMIDSKVLRFLCRNPSGMFWAGDTAQQITSTAFRFSELKAFLYNIEEADSLVQSRRREAVHPKEFTLSINYRSHGGIINCAHSVIQLLMTLWPDSIDALDPEQGLVDGPKPIFFSGWDRGSVHYEQFLFGEAGNRMEFGAEQCILVRNDAARDELRRQIGDVGLIMTLYESKGLEFNDVLLYNFFENSVVESGWRVVLNAVEEKKRGGLAVPTFNDLRHIGVCSELKFLYVGLTRARNHLWIWDSSPVAEFMKIFWESRDMIDIKRPGDPLPRIAVSSSAEEWAKMGRTMFARENYQQAIVCFDRANQPLESSISQAYHLRKVARLLQIGTDERKRAFIEAADAFFACASEDHLQSRACYLRAAECYAESDKDSDASKSYCLGGDFTKGAKHARMAGEFDRALQIIQGNKVEAEVASSIVEVCKVVYVHKEEYSKARDLFLDEEELLQHAEECGFDKAPILVELNRLEEAAEYQFQNGLTMEAIELLIRAHSQDSMHKAAAHLLEELWLTLPYNRHVTHQNKAKVTRLLNLSKSVTDMPVSWIREISMFKAILEDDDHTLQNLVDNFSIADQFLPTLRCAYHLLEKDPDIRDLSPEEMDRHLMNIRHLSSSIRIMLRKSPTEIAQAPETGRLLAYTILDENSGQEAVVRISSPLHRKLSELNKNQSSVRYLRSGRESEIVVSLADVSDVVWSLLDSDLRRFLQSHDSQCKSAYAFKPLCIANITENCRYGDTCTFLHVPLDTMKQSFNQRFRMYLGQALVINDMYVALDFETRNWMRREWMSRFTQFLFPQYSSSGKLADLVVDPSGTDHRIIEGLAVLRDWIEESIYTLNLSNSPRVLEIFLISSALDHYGVPKYIGRTNLLRKIPQDGYRVDVMAGERRAISLNLYNGLFAHGDAAMVAGINYLHHVIEYRAELDANILISMLEVVTALLVAGLKPDLDGLYIPQSWLFVLGQRQRWPRTRTLHFTNNLLIPLMRLSHGINDGYSHLTLDRKPLHNVSTTHRRMLIERIFRCLILVGCNAAPGNTCTKQILQSITRIAAGVDVSKACWPLWYVQATTWEALVGAAVRSLSNSKTDHIIQLVKLGSSGGPIRGVPQESFHSTEALFHCFITSPLVNVGKKSKLRPTAKEFVPGNPSTRAVVDHKTSTSSKPEGGAGDASTGKAPVPSQEILFTESMDESHLKESYTKEEVQAVNTIKIAYMRYRKRHRAESVTPNREAVEKWFKRFSNLQNSRHISKRYLAILRGPLSHFMICLDAYRVEVAQQKVNAKRTLTGDHRLLEEALSRMSDINKLNNWAHGSIRRVGPESSVHKEVDEAKRLETIREIIKDIAVRMKGTLGVDPDLRYHFDLAYKGIVQEQKPTIIAPEPKPTLNTSDLYEV